MSFTPSSGFDRLNPEVLAGLLPIGVPVSEFLTELPNSPTIEFGEQCTITHMFEGDWYTCLNLRLARGTYLTDSDGNINRVLTCKIGQRKGNIGQLTVTTESISFAVPPDEFAYDPVEANPALEKNPRYTSADPANPDALLTTADIVQIRAALEAPQEATRSEALIQNPYSATGPTPDAFKFGLWNELYTKLRRGEENYYSAGIKITWAQYSFSPLPLNLGGYIEDPTLVMPSQFWIGVDGPVIPGGMSFLRFADSEPYNRTWWKHQMTWLGFAGGAWDPDIYTKT